MYVCGSRTATRGPPTPVRPSVIRPAYLCFARGSCQRFASAFAISKPTLWRVPAYSAPGFPSPTMSQSTCAPGRRTAAGCYSPPESSSADASASPASPSPTTPVSCSISSVGSTESRGGVTVTTGVSQLVEQRDAVRDRDRGERDRVADLGGRDVVDDRVRDRGRKRFDVQLARDLLEHATGLHARRVLDTRQLEHDGRVDLLREVDAQQVDVHRRARDRVTLVVLQHDRRLRCALERERHDRSAVREREAQLACVDLEGKRLAFAAVDDAGDEALAAEAARGTRSLDGAGGNGECGCL